MSTNRQRYHRHRFPPEVISHAVWLYRRFCLSFRDVEDLLAERGVTVSYETIRLWCRKFGLDGDLLDILIQRRRNERAARRVFRKLLRGQGSEPRRLITDKLGSYRAAHRSVMPPVEHVTARHAINRAEVSQQPTRQRERQMRKFKSAARAQRFLSIHGVVRNLFRLSPHRLRAADYRTLRGRAFAVWSEVVAA